MTLTVEGVSQAILSYRYRFDTEAELQDGIEQALKAGGVSYMREAILSKQDRIDFLVGSIGIEIKIGGTLAEVTRQLHRYAQLDSIKSLVLVTCKLRLNKLPETINGKPLKVIPLLESMF